MQDQNTHIKPRGLAARLLTETTLFLSDLPRRLPRGPGDRLTHTSTALRWVLRGVGGVKLEAVRVGGRWVTSEEALARFVDAQTPTGTVSSPTLHDATPEAPRRRETERQLEAEGL